MKSVIVGTAGHIDHGKTALVKALTGIDADRLEEEKRRGITIDLGFAHLEMRAPDGSPVRLGFVDVPGHERFVRNMLAGVGGIDLVLLVIAADEGIKPQTREHFDICRLLSIPRGITVLSKSDAVNEETLTVLRLEVEEYLRGSFLDAKRSPVVPVSALTGAGVSELKAALAKMASEVESRSSKALARLPIDRVFTMKGFGTVVTGTLVAGAIGKEEELEMFPTGARVRVRGMQVHGASASNAVAGERTALNLSGVRTEELHRGMMLAAPDTFHATGRADALISFLATAKTFRSGSTVHFHSYTAETTAKVRIHKVEAMKPGADAYARLEFAEPMMVLPGDRFIIRQFSPAVTIGGGVILDASVTGRKQNAEATVTFLKVMRDGMPGPMLAARVARQGVKGLRLNDVPGDMNLRMACVRDLARDAGLRVCNQVLLAANAVDTARSNVLQTLKTFHDANPLVAGMSREELRERTSLSPDVLECVLTQLADEKKLEIAAEVVQLAGRGVAFKDEEAKSKTIIEEAFASSGLKVPALKEVLANLQVDKIRAQKIVTLLLREKILVKISDDLIFHQRALSELRQRVAGLKRNEPKIDVARFKDLTGVSRKYAIPLLEYLDRERITRRAGDERVIL